MVTCVSESLLVDNDLESRAALDSTGGWGYTRRRTAMAGGGQLGLDDRRLVSRDYQRPPLQLLIGL